MRLDQCSPGDVVLARVGDSVGRVLVRFMFRHVSGDIAVRPVLERNGVQFEVDRFEWLRASLDVEVRLSQMERTMAARSA